MDDKDSERLDPAVLSEEVAEREAKYARLQREMSELRYKIEEIRCSGFIRSGVAAEVLVAESFRKRLQAELLRKEKHCALIKEELIKFEDRMRQEIAHREEEI